MKFKVVLVGHIMMQTSDASCVYDDETIRSLNSAGYKTYVDGRIYRPPKEEKDGHKQQK